MPSDVLGSTEQDLELFFFIWVLTDTWQSFNGGRKTLMTKSPPRKMTIMQTNTKK